MASFESLGQAFLRFSKPQHTESDICLAPQLFCCCFKLRRRDNGRDNEFSIEIIVVWFCSFFFFSQNNKKKPLIALSHRIFKEKKIELRKELI